MSIDPSTNYMSNATIMAWMESKTDDLYGKMRDAMDTTDHRSNAEAALNKIKGDLLLIKTQNATTEQVTKEINAALADFADVPELTKALQPFADTLNTQYEAAAGAAAAQQELDSLPPLDQVTDPVLAQHIAVLQQTASAKPPWIPDADVDSWSKSIEGAVDGLSKQDQLGMLNIQEFNAQINQAKQTASALMDASDKSADAIISHIS